MFRLFTKKPEQSEAQARAERTTTRKRIEAEIKLCKEMAACAEIATIKLQLRKAAELI